MSKEGREERKNQSREGKDRKRKKGRGRRPGRSSSHKQSTIPQGNSPTEIIKHVTFRMEIYMKKLLERISDCIS